MIFSSNISIDTVVQFAKNYSYSNDCSSFHQIYFNIKILQNSPLLINNDLWKGFQGHTARFIIYSASGTKCLKVFSVIMCIYVCSVVQKVFDRKYFIDKKLKIKCFWGYITFLKYFLNQARTWFLKIDPVRIVCMRVCVCVCVCPRGY